MLRPSQIVHTATPTVFSLPGTKGYSSKFGKHAINILPNPGNINLFNDRIKDGILIDWCKLGQYFGIALLEKEIPSSRHIWSYGR